MGHHEEHDRLYEPHDHAGGTREVANRHVQAVAAAHLHDHRRDQPPLAHRRARPLSEQRAEGPRALDHPGRHGPHGSPVDRRFAQRQRRCENPYGHPEVHDAARILRVQSAHVQQQDERHHAPPLAHGREPGALRPHRCDHRQPPLAPSSGAARPAQRLC